MIYYSGIALQIEDEQLAQRMLISLNNICESIGHVPTQQMDSETYDLGYYCMGEINVYGIYIPILFGANHRRLRAFKLMSPLIDRLVMRVGLYY